MIRRYPFFTIMLLVILNVNAQSKTEAFIFGLPEQKIAGSLYNAIQLIDIRPDTFSLGIIQKGAFNRKIKLVAEQSLATQCSTILNTLIDSSTNNGELLLLLREFNFAEVTSALSERGYVHLRAMMFCKQNNRFYKLAAIDTVVVVAAMDVTKKMLRLGSKTFTGFIAANLTKSPQNDLSIGIDSLNNVNFGITEIAKIDSIEKSKVPAYTVTNFVDGFYKNYNSFALQQPAADTTVTVEFKKKGEFKNVKCYIKNSHSIAISTHNSYPFVYLGKAYIVTKYGYYPIEKRDGDLYFTGKASNVKQGDLATATMFFGIIGGLIASSETSTFELKIDHLSGGFKTIKKIE